ncbi:hypothetical protein J2T60_000818 [Natronospira proteinivora]|uniref:Uncharacterized protein n=1 Tax=Natronospira proteinivora TaxID=1807133 RepID=A0ABT1G6C5_9GAMM|nr:hypothetical protein [Natronospira proteinivora]MCP1726853.1 hypothetical protein [Natronospira proteinivora]
MDSIPFMILTALLLTVFVLGGVVLVLRRQRDQRPYTTVKDPDVTMARVWAEWMEADLASSHHKLRAEARRILASHQRQAIYDDLLTFEEKILGGQYPLTKLRQEMMASVDRRMINVEILRLPEDDKSRLRREQPEVIQTDNHAREYILANELRLALLREYAARRYGDRAENDWLYVYERAAQYKRRLTKARILQGLAASEEGDEDSRQQAIDVVDRQLQIRLLQVPPGTTFKQDDP